MMMTSSGPDFNAFFYPPNRIPNPGSLHAFFENIPGKLEGLLNFISMAAVDDEAMAEAFDLVQSCLAFKRAKANWEEYEHRILYWERVCEAVGMSSLDFRVAVMNQVDLYSSHLSHLQAIGAQPDLVKTSIAVGMLPTDKAFNDRRAIYQHNKFVPVPTTTITATSTVQNLQVSAPPALTVPSFEQLADQSLKAIMAEEPKQLGPGVDNYIEEDEDEDEEDDLVLVEQENFNSKR